MSLPHLRQFRHFHYGKSNKLATSMIEKFPQTEILFSGNSDLEFTEGGEGELFCHELGHMVDLYLRNKVEKLFLPDFGSPIVSRGWTEKMADNECKAVALQGIYSSHLGLQAPESLLDEGGLSIFIRQSVGVKKDYLSIIRSYREEFRPVALKSLEDVLNLLLEVAKRRT